MSIHREQVRVMVVEDNPYLLEELLFQLSTTGFSVRGARDGVTMDALLHETPCDVLVLDLNLPGEHGYSIARRMCDPARLGIIMLTARDAIEDKLQGFDEGADNYFVKPLDHRELVACILALYRRLHPSGAAPTGWVLKQGERALHAPDGKTLALSAQEFTVVTLLTQESGRMCSRAQMVQALGIDFMEAPDARLNTVLSRCRQKLAAFDPELKIMAWRNQGYSYVGPGIAQV